MRTIATRQNIRNSTTSLEKLNTSKQDEKIKTNFQVRSSKRLAENTERTGRILQILSPTTTRAVPPYKNNNKRLKIEEECHELIFNIPQNKFKKEKNLLNKIDEISMGHLDLLITEYTSSSDNETVNTNKDEGTILLSDNNENNNRRKHSRYNLRSRT